MVNPPAVRSHIWSAIGAHGLYLTDHVLDRHLIGLAQRGRQLLTGELEPRFAARLPGLYGPHADVGYRRDRGRIAAFAWLYCDVMQRAIGSPPSQRANVAAALLAITVTALDDAVDRGAEVDATLEALRVLGRDGSFAAALTTGAPLDRHDRPPQLVPALTAMDAFCAEIRGLVAASSDRVYATALVGEMMRAIDDALDAEIASADLGFDRDPDRSGLDTMRAANTLPQWITAYLALLPWPGVAPSVRDDLESATVDIGDLMWTLDDLCDCAEDLAARRWNRVWYAAVDRMPALLARLRAGDLEVWEPLLASEVIDELAGSIEHRLHRLATYAALDAGGVAALQTWARVMIWSWLLPSAAGA